MLILKMIKQCWRTYKKRINNKETNKNIRFNLKKFQTVDVQKN